MTLGASFRDKADREIVRKQIAAEKEKQHHLKCLDAGLQYFADSYLPAILEGKERPPFENARNGGTWENHYRPTKEYRKNCSKSDHFIPLNYIENLKFSEIAALPGFQAFKTACKSCDVNFSISDNHITAHANQPWPKFVMPWSYRS